MQLIYGVGVAAIGIALTLGNLGLADPGAILAYWPVAIIVGGVLTAVRADDPPGRVWGGFWIMIGVWFLSNTTGHSHVSLWDFLWPMALVALGVKLWVDALRRDTPQTTRTAPLGPEASHLTAILAGSTRVVQEPTFTGASMTTLLGNCTLDLHLSGPPANGEAVIELLALLGAHEIIVPEGWTVVNETTAIGATVDDQRSSFAGRTIIEGDTRPRIIVRGTLILSGVTIKH
jgi:hypothetical protein